MSAVSEKLVMFRVSGDVRGLRDVRGLGDVRDVRDDSNGALFEKLFLPTGGVTDIFVIDNKENVSLINYKIVHEYTMTFFFAINYTFFCHYSVL